MKFAGFKLFSLNGRVNRLTFWWVNVVIISFYGCLYLLIGRLEPVLTELLGAYIASDVTLVSWTTWLVAAILISLNLLSLAASVCIAVQRFHDLDRTGWWFLAYFAGSSLVAVTTEFFQISLGSFDENILDVLVYAYLAFKAGTDGSNRFGADPITGAVAQPEVFGN